MIRISDNAPASCKDKSKHEDKTLDNIRRAARMIEAYGLCNEWDYFVTLTVDPRRYSDRLDLDVIRQDFMQMLRNIRRLCSCSIDVLIVPELHRNRQGWHFHGLIRGLPLSELHPFELHGFKLPSYVIQKLKSGQIIYDWPRYRKKFGFVDVEPIGNRDAAVRYIKKYITKGLDSTAKEISLGKHTYFVTRGLQLPQKWESATYTVTLPRFLRGLAPESSYQWDYGTADWYKLDQAHVELITQSSMMSSDEGRSSGCELDNGGDFFESADL